MPFQTVVGYDAFKSALGQLMDNNVIVYFRGEKENGQNWCPDCRKSDDIVESTLATANDKTYAIVVDVGGRDFWKNPSNPFKIDEHLLIKGIPTLLNVKTGERITDENELAKAETVQGFLQ